MRRSAALVGFLAILVGVVLQLVSSSLGPVRSDTPMGTAGTWLQQFVLPLGGLIMAVGAVMVSLAIVARATGTPPVRGSHLTLLWAGLGLWFVHLVLPGLVMGALWPDGTGSGAVPGVTTLLGLFEVVRLLGVGLLGAWAYGAVTGTGAEAAPVDDVRRRVRPDGRAGDRS